MMLLIGRNFPPKVKAEYAFHLSSVILFLFFNVPGCLYDEVSFQNLIQWHSALQFSHVKFFFVVKPCYKIFTRITPSTLRLPTRKNYNTSPRTWKHAVTLWCLAKDQWNSIGDNRLSPNKTLWLDFGTKRSLVHSNFHSHDWQNIFFSFL